MNHNAPHAHVAMSLDLAHKVGACISLAMTVLMNGEARDAMWPLYTAKEKQAFLGAVGLLADTATPQELAALGPDRFAERIKASVECLMRLACTLCSDGEGTLEAPPQPPREWPFPNHRN